jgi:hypothetical protein
MKTTIAILSTAVIILLALLLIKPDPTETIRIETKTKTDTVRIVNTVYKPKPIKETVTVTDTVIDTVQVVKESQLQRDYELTITDDTNSKISALVTVQFNSIQRYSVKGEVYHKTIERNHYVIEKPTYHIGAGIIASNKSVLAPVASFQSKRGDSYMAGWNVANNSPIVGVVFRIK